MGATCGQEQRHGRRQLRSGGAHSEQEVIKSGVPKGNSLQQKIPSVHLHLEEQNPPRHPLSLGRVGGSNPHLMPGSGSVTFTASNDQPGTIQHP